MENPDNDFGIEIEGNMPNLFAEFHKNQTAGEDVKPINVKPAPDPATPDPAKPAGSVENPDQASGKTTPIDAATILGMAKDQALGKTNSDDNSADDPASTKKPAAGATVAPVSGDVYTVLYQHLTDELGFEPLNEEEDGAFDGTDEKFLLFHQKNVELQGEAIAIDMIKKAFADPNDPKAVLAKDLFVHLTKGGDVDRFLESRQNDTITPEFLALATEDDLKEARAEIVMRKSYKAMNWEDEAIEKTIKALKTSGTMVTMAETTLPQFIKQSQAKKAIEDQQLAQNNVNKQREVKEYNTKLFSAIDTLKEIGPFSLATAKEKQAIKEYMFVPSVEINGKKVPQYVADLEEAKKHPLFTLHQAISLQKKGIDYSKISETATQKATQILKDKLEAAAKSKKVEQPSGAAASTTSNERANPRAILDFDNIQFA